MYLFRIAVLAGPIPVMTKQNASLKPAVFPVSSDSFRPLVQKFSSTNSSTNSIILSSNNDVSKSKKLNMKLTVSFFYRAGRLFF